MELPITEFSLRRGNGGGFAQSVAVSTVSAQSTALVDVNTAIVVATTSCFVHAGSNPVAVADGTDPYLTVGMPYRVRFVPGQKLAFISTGGTGTVFITPVE